MKKVLIILLAVFLVLGGVVSFFLFNNNSAMLTIFNKDAEKIKNVATAAISKLNEQKYCDLETYYKLHTEDNSVSMESSSQIKMIKNSDTEIGFYAVWTRNYQESGESETATMNCYYTDSILYKEIFNSDGTTKSKTKTECDLDYALSAFSYWGTAFVFPNSEEFLTDDDNYVYDSKFLFGLSPFVIGETLTFTEDAQTAYMNIDVFGNIKELGINYSAQQGNYNYIVEGKTTYKNFKKLAIEYPTDLEEYELY